MRDNSPIGPATLSFEIPDSVVAWLLDDMCLKLLAWGDPMWMIVERAFWYRDRYGAPTEISTDVQ